MRTHGNLIKWNDERGFGFISSAHGGEEIFVHISAFQRGGERPRIGELVSYEAEIGPNGKRRAVGVMRAGETRAVRPRVAKRSARPRSRANKGIIVLLLAVVAVYGYSRVSSPRVSNSHMSNSPVSSSRMQPFAERVETPVRHQPADTSAEDFTCDGRKKCGQMTSCEEATNFLKHCPNTEMDGDGDGVPCESQWCSWP